MSMLVDSLEQSTHPGECSRQKHRPRRRRPRPQQMRDSVVLGVAAVFVLFAATQARGATVWSIETVDRGGQFNSLALDAGGHPHVSYWGGSSRGLEYARFDGSDWHLETVDDETSFEEGSVGLYTSLALDSSGNPHIAYRDGAVFPNGNLKYARLDASGWHISTVDAGTVGWFASLALDGLDRPHISYHDGATGKVKYATSPDGVTWSSIAIADGAYSSIAIDEIGLPAIAFTAAGGGLEYARPDGVGGWSVETVDDTSTAGYFPSLAIAMDGTVHVTSIDIQSDCCVIGNLEYARLDASGWHIETVDPGGEATRTPSLTLDVSGNPHIAYPTDTYNHAYWDGGSWKYETVAGGTTCCSDMSIAVDGSDRPHVTFQRSGLDYALGRADTDEDGIPDEADPDTAAGIASGLDAAVFNAPGNQQALLSRLENTEELIQAWYDTGDTAARDQAIAELQNLLRRLDGCGTSPDSNDWITDCTAQVEVREAIQSIVDTLLAA